MLFRSPIEAMLRDIPIPTHVASGAEDSGCPPSFIKYLKSVCSANPKVSFSIPVAGAAHEVTGDSGERTIQDYDKALFGVFRISIRKYYLN